MDKRTKTTGLVWALAASQAVLGATTTSSAGVTMMTSSTTLKLATTYSGSNFFSGFNFFTADDPTGGYVNYVSQATAQTNGLAAVQSDGTVVMRADTASVATGRGRDSVRISSKSQWADGVYILDFNHLPVGCGTWPAFWTVTENGWPKGGEIDIIEGANTLPSLNSSSWNATLNSSLSTNTTFANLTSTSLTMINSDVASLHTSDNCQLSSNTYMTGTMGSNQCSAYVNGNMGCGAVLGGNSTYGSDSFGAGVNGVGGGWYAMWRDIANSGGVYVYYWPRNSLTVPSDVRDPFTQATNVANWGPPGANLTIPSCKGDFGNHVIVFNIAFCGDYSAATYAQSGCPGTCPTFVRNNPKAFGEAYWSINSLRVYTASGQAAPTGTVLSTGAIAGIVVGSVAFVIICGLIFWRYRVTRRRRREAEANQALAVMVDNSSNDDDEMVFKTNNAWVGGSSLYQNQYQPDQQFQPSSQILTSNQIQNQNQNQTSTLPVIVGQDEGGKIIRLATAKARTGKTTLQPGKTALHHLEGETHAGYYHQQSENVIPETSQIALNGFTSGPAPPGLAIPVAASASASRKGSVAAPENNNSKGIKISLPTSAKRKSSVAPASPIRPASRQAEMENSALSSPSGTSGSGVNVGRYSVGPRGTMYFGTSFSGPSGAPGAARNPFAPNSGGNRGWAG